MLPKCVGENENTGQLSCNIGHSVTPVEGFDPASRTNTNKGRTQLRRHDVAHGASLGAER